MTAANRADSPDPSSPAEQPDEAVRGMLRDSRQRQAEVSALLKGSRAVLEYREFQDAARAIFDACKELIGAESGYVALSTPDGTENEVSFLDSGGLPCTVDPSLPMPIRGLREVAYRTGEAVFDNDFAQSRWTEFLPKGHSRLDNVLFAPLLIRRQVVGLLGLANKPDGFTDHDARMAFAFGELAAIALQNSRTLEALENSEERLRALTQSANDGIISTDQADRIIYWNDAAERMFGYTAEQIMGKPLTTIIPQHAREAHTRGLQRIASTGTSKVIGKTVEGSGLKADGSEFPIELSLSQWRNKEETFFTGIVRDITERKRIQQRNEAIIRTSLDGFWVIDRTGNILEVNDAYCDLVGYTRDELLSMNVRELENRESPDEIHEHLRKLIEMGFDRFETSHLRKDGTEVDMDVSANYLPIDGGRICTFFRDITERKEAEAALRTSQRELAIRNRIAKIFLTCPDEEIYAEVLEVHLKTMQSTYGYFGYIDEKGNLVCPSMTRNIWDECQIKDKVIVFPRETWGGLWGKSLIEKKSLYSNGPMHVPEGHVTMQRALVVPIIHNGRVIGQFAMANKDSDYLQEDLALLEAVADHVAPVLHARLAQERLERERKQAEQRVKFLAAFPSENPDPVMRVGRDGTLIHANDSSQPLLDAWDCRIGRTLPESLSTSVSDAFASGRRTDVDVECNQRTIVLRLVPVAAAGYVNVYGRDITERKWERKFLEITNRHAEMRPLLEEFVAEVKRFTGCAAAGIRILDEDGGIPYQIRDGFSAQFYELESPLSISEDRCMCINVIKGEVDAAMPFYSEGGSFLMNGTTRFLATISEEEKGDTRNACNEFGYESVALVPIRLGDRILGLIHVADPRENATPPEMVESLERIGMQLGAAIQRVYAEEALRDANEELETRVRLRTGELEKANRELTAEIAQRRRLETEVLEIGTREQRRIGQELHDGLGQELTGLSYLATSLHRKLRSGDFAEADTAAELSAGIPRVLGQVQRIVKGLVPLGVGADDLVPALQLLATSVEERTGVPCSFESNGPESDAPVKVRDDNAAVQLYRIAQEAVNNAVKHARSSMIAVTIGADRDRITLQVRDDGVGFPPDDEKGSGSGMHIMRYRARVIGGTLEIKPGTGGGTLVTCSLPLE